MKLSNEQQEIVNSEEKRISIQAVAGSGKTTTVLHLVQKLNLENKVQKVLFISFSNAAKDAINNKISDDIILEENFLSSTFAKFYFDIIKIRYGYKVTFNPTLKSLFNSNDESYENKMNNVKERIASDSNKVVVAEEVEIFLLELIKNSPERVSGMFSPLVDFDMIVIDEGADTDLLQLILLKKLVDLSGKDFRIVLSGDENQMISDFRNVPNFSMQVTSEMFDCKKFKLQTNFRSSDEIIFHTNSLLKSMESNLVTKLIQYTPSGDKYAMVNGKVLEMGMDIFIPRLVSLISQSKMNDESFAIICRSNKNLRELQGELLKEKISISIKTPDESNIASYMRDIVSEFKKGKAIVMLDGIKGEWKSLENMKNLYPNGIKVKEFVNFVIENSKEIRSENAENKKSDDPIYLMTIHSSKGLEFDNVVFLTNGGSDSLSETQRLAYVALTRPKKSLIQVRIPSMGDGMSDENSYYLTEVLKGMK